MEGCKKTENTTGSKINGESKIPKSAKFSSTKETSSKTLGEKKTVPSSKIAREISDLKPCAAFGGIKLTKKRNACQKVDAFKKVSKDPQVVNPPGPCTEKLKSTDPVKVIASKENEHSNNGMLEDPPTAARASLKAASLIVTKATITSSKMKQTQIGNLPKNMKRMSVVQIARDVESRFQDENSKSDYQTTESDAGIKILDQENLNEREPLKEKVSHGQLKEKASQAPTKEKASQAPQKQSGSLTKKPSSSDLQTCKTFGGIKLTSKRNTCRKGGVFQTATKESKDLQVVNSPETCPKKLKTTDPVKAIANKGIEQFNKGNLEDPSAATRESSKAALLTATKTTLKKCTTYGGMRFKPNWHSTPLKPDLLENILKLSKHEKDVNTPDLSAKCLEKIPDSTKAVTKEIETITIDETINLDNAVQPTSKEPKYLKPASITEKESGQVAAFGGTGFAPKWESTPIRPYMFENIQKESRAVILESYHTDSSAKELKKIPFSTTAKIKVDTQHSDDEKLELLRTQKPEMSKNFEASRNVKKVTPPVFGGLRFKPRQKNLHNVFEAQKSKVDNQRQF